MYVCCGFQRRAKYHLTTDAQVDGSVNPYACTMPRALAAGVCVEVLCRLRPCRNDDIQRTPGDAFEDEKLLTGRWSSTISYREDGVLFCFSALNGVVV